MRKLAIFLLLTLLLACPQPALADVAPPINPPGANLEPGAESTAVEMRHETVLIDVKNGGTNNLGVARVTADFSLHNPSSQTEQLAVRFPISANDGRFEYPEIANIQIRVDGRSVGYTRVNYPSLGWGDEELPWAEFTVNFPAGADTAIQVSYDLQGSGYFPYSAFYYVLHTGAGWSGNIGRAEITLRLPYPANPQNVVLDTQIGWAETTPGGVFDGSAVHWVFEDFEPGAGGPVRDMEFALVAPAAWKALLGAQAEIKARPRDGEAWGRLAKRYKDFFLQSKGYRADPGGEELYRLSVEAYEECLRLKPNDAQWHAGFAELLAQRAYWDNWTGDPVPETYRALEEIHTALRLAPRDPIVLDIAENSYWLLEGGILEGETGYDFPWLTQTPTPLPPTATLAPSFDPQALAGTYTSGQITLSNGKFAQLNLVVSTDHTATLETLLQDAPAAIASGAWTDIGDGDLRLVVTDASGETFEFVYLVKPESLVARQYPAAFGTRPDLVRFATPTPTATPALSATPALTWTPHSPQQTVVVEGEKLATASLDTPTPEAGGETESTPGSAPIAGPCGALFLALLPPGLWLLRRRL